MCFERMFIEMVVQAQAEICSLIEQLIDDFGPQEVDVVKILDFAKTTLEKKTPVSSRLISTDSFIIIWNHS